MFIKIVFESEVPIYTQLRNQIVEGIAKGELSEGDDLPSVRQLAEDIGINMHTVNKAYNVLKQEGFITIDRRRGAIVSIDISSSKEEILKKLQEEMKVVLSEAYCKRITKEEIMEMVTGIYKEFEGDV